MWRSFDSGSDIVNVTGFVTQGDEWFTTTKNWIFLDNAILELWFS